jgi:hypothetical protein
MSPPALLAIAAPLVLWRMYMRFRRMVGRQPSHLWRHWCATVLMPLLLAAIGWLALPFNLALSGWAAGLVGGVALAGLGLRLTRFEATPQGYFYVPNMHFGVALTALLVARLAYRAVVLYEGGSLPLTHSAVPGMAPHVAIIHLMVTNPLTLGIISLRLGYAAAYAAGLLRWRLAHRARDAAPPAL